MKKTAKVVLTTILLALAIFFCFYKLSKPELETWDEYIYFGVIYDTVESRDHLILKKNNWYTFRKECPDLSEDQASSPTCTYTKQTSDKFFEKPLLWFYLALISTKVFGINNFSVRIISALSGLGIVALVFYLGWKMFSYKAGLVAAFSTLATRHLFLESSKIFSTHSFRTADMDALQLLLIMLSFWSFWQSMRFTREKKYSLLALAGILTGLGLLTKGPFALIPLITFSLYQLLNYKRAKIKQLLISFLIIIFTLLIITLPWHIYMHIRFGEEFWNSYIGYHVIKRGISSLEGHTEPWYFYITLLFRKDFFFSGELLLVSLAYLVKKYSASLVTINYSLFSCLIAPFITLILITIIQTKISWYVFPAYPFMFLLIGKSFEEFFGIKNKVLRYVISGIIAISLIVQICINFFLILKL
ncbi:glycosyltransferase family 39 protein [Candidatus Dojkabacteria bacterium]|nr:glycosyltransferase family 39 protein [Candidatus Dojkabacteria bacterium]